METGKKVLFIGLPCQVSAVKKYIPNSLKKNLFTIDLICHGSPSPQLLWKYLKEHEKNNVVNIRFRNKQNQLFTNYKPIVPIGIADRYMISFLQAYNYTENCYSCRFACTDRISDITLGDSWGSTLPIDEQKKGISLVLCQTDKGEEMLKISNLYLESVDIENAKKHNAQLNAPEVKPKGREKFFKAINKNKSYDRAVFTCFPTLCLKQDLKKVLFKIRPYKGHGKTNFRLMVITSSDTKNTY